LTGLFADEGWNLAEIIEMGETGHFPLFFANNPGREPVFIYLQTAITLIARATPFAARVAAAFVVTMSSTTTCLLARPHPFPRG